MTAANRYFIDGEDAYLVYGFAVSEGSDTFLQPNKRKEPYGYDWKDGNGIEYDLLEPVFEARTFQLNGVIIGDNELDFKIKWNAFSTIWGLGGSRTIEVAELGTSVEVFCQEFSQTERLTRIKGGGKVYTKVALTLKEVTGAFINILIIDSTI